MGHAVPTLAIWDRALNYYTEYGVRSLFVAAQHDRDRPFRLLHLRRAREPGFLRLKPRMTTIYDPYFWLHERHWKLADSPIVACFAGTPFRPMILRLLGVKVGQPGL